jgi:hypothetical protein
MTAGGRGVRLLGCTCRGDPEAIKQAKADAIKAGYSNTAVGAIGRTPSGVFLFSKLPQADQQAILRQANKDEFERYVTHAHMKLRKPMRDERGGGAAVEKSASSPRSAPPPPPRGVSSVGRAGVGLAIVSTGAFIAYTSLRANAWFGRSLTPDPVAGEVYSNLSVAAEIIACLIPTGIRFYWTSGEPWTALRGWALMAVGRTSILGSTGLVTALAAGAGSSMRSRAT